MAEHGIVPSVLVLELRQRPLDVALQALPRRQVPHGAVFRFPDGPGGKAAEHGLFPSVLIFELFQRPFDVALQALPGG